MLWKPGMDTSSTRELPAISLGILAHEIRNLGHEVFVEDNEYWHVPLEDTIRLLKEEKPDILGISMVSQEWSLDKTHTVISAASEMGIEIWIGGPHTCGYWDIIERDERLSRIVVGGTDNAFEQLLASSDRVIHLPQPIDLSLPDFTFMSHYKEMFNYPLFTSRGCNYSCNFCAIPGINLRRRRERALDDEFWEQIDKISVNHPKVDRVSIVDDDFISNMEHAMEFLEGYLSRGYPYKLYVLNARANKITREFVRLIKKCGVVELPLGVESGSPEVFRQIRKGETLEDIRKAALIIQEEGVIPWLNMIIGLPKDSPETNRQSIEWVESTGEREY